MMDLVSRIRQEQLKLSERYAHHIFREVRSDLDNHNLNSLNEYLREPLLRLDDNTGIGVSWDNIDLKTLKLLAKNMLGVDMHVAVIGYTNYLGSRIANDQIYTVPTVQELNLEFMSDYFYVKQKILKRAVLFMHSEYKLPLLGKIRNGKFNPHPEELREYSSLLHD